MRMFAKNDKPAINPDVTIKIEGLTKVYRIGDVEVHALRGIDLEVKRGELVSIMGPSGSGKSTMMNIIGCLDTPTSGECYIDGIKMSKLNDNQLAEIRNKKIGFVFQSFNLLPRIPAIDQVELPLIYGSGEHRRERAKNALESVGLSDRMHHRPTELSGGQQQRVAIARALVTSPSIILADEPTGNLDTRSSEEIMAIFQKLNHDQGITIVFVTHEADIASHTQRVIRMRDGKMLSDETVATPRLAAEVLAALPDEHIQEVTHR